VIVSSDRVAITDWSEKSCDLSDVIFRLRLVTMAHPYPPGRGGYSGASQPASQGRGVNAYVNLFKISLDRLSKTVYQYDGTFPCFSPFNSSSHCDLVGQ
jgi:hypothetical protein